MKALIVYRSRTGITERFGKEINELLNSQGIESKVLPVENYSDIAVTEPDIVFLGCWTAGFMLLFQHPDREWKKFAQRLPDLKNKKVALFTTYKIATGSMFKSMRKYLSGKSANIMLELKSKDGKINDGNKKDIIDLIK